MAGFLTERRRMNFKVGDRVVHWFYGLGEVVQLDEKKLLDRSEQYYVVKIRDLTIWVPVNDNGDHSLRYPTPADHFAALFEILSSDPEPLSSDRMARKSQLSDLLRGGKLDEVCRAVRDLTYQRRIKKAE
jgi:RNA polymerase-interacting CarD/CdnL/TRCF family regulator